VQQQGWGQLDPSQLNPHSWARCMATPNSGTRRYCTG
jgi:hypothetical protein